MTSIDLCGAAIILGINSNPVLAKDTSFKPSSENGIEDSETIGLRKVEDGSVISNLHTSKWRVFTDTARDLFLQASSVSFTFTSS